jgi:hypothetical protein
MKSSFHRVCAKVFPPLFVVANSFDPPEQLQSRKDERMDLSPDSLMQWELLAGSPMASTACVSLNGGDDISLSLAALDIDGGPPAGMLDSYVHLDDDLDPIDGSVLYAYFDREAGAADFSVNGRCVQNFRPVRARPVRCDHVAYTRSVSNYGACGHRFSLSYNNTPTATIEAFETVAGEIDQLLVTHAMHSPIGVMAGLIDKSTFLQFCSPDSHILKLERLVFKLEVDQVYLPLNELVVGAAIDTVTLGGEQCERACRAWDVVLRTMMRVSELARSGVVAHNARELACTHAAA